MLINHKHPLAKNAYVRDPFTKEKIGTIFALDTETGEAHEWVLENGRIVIDPPSPLAPEPNLRTKVSVRPWELLEKDTDRLIAKSYRKK